MDKKRAMSKVKLLAVLLATIIAVMGFAAHAARCNADNSTHTISLDLRGGTFVDASVGDNFIKLRDGEKLYPSGLPQLTREDFEFVFWSFEVQYGQKPVDVFAAEGFIVVEQDIKLYATWQAQNHDYLIVVFDDPYGKQYHDTLVLPNTVLDTSDLPTWIMDIENDPIMDWINDQTKFDFDDKIVTDTYLRALDIRDEFDVDYGGDIDMYTVVLIYQDKIDRIKDVVKDTKLVDVLDPEQSLVEWFYREGNNFVPVDINEYEISAFTILYQQVDDSEDDNDGDDTVQYGTLQLGDLHFEKTDGLGEKAFVFDGVNIFDPFVDIKFEDIVLVTYEFWFVDVGEQHIATIDLQDEKLRNFDRDNWTENQKYLNGVLHATGATGGWVVKGENNVPTFVEHDAQIAVTARVELSNQSVFVASNKYTIT